MRSVALAAGVAVACTFSACERTPTPAIALNAAAACGPAQLDASPYRNMVLVAAGSFTMGSNTAFPEEAPAAAQSVGDFWIDRTEVTNEQFAEFVTATGYLTLAERGVRTAPALDAPVVAGSAVFAPNSDKLNASPRNAEYWWRFVPGASWRAPEGPGSSLIGRARHPVVHIAYEDALAYARWRGRSLPTEAQWEFAARGGRDGEDDWSSAFDADGKPTANTWQGIFPVMNTNEDGYAGTAPVGCFKPNGYGLYDMIGNVWEWTNDWYRAGHSREAAINPTGPDFGSIRVAAGQSARRVIKGGSHLCASNYCSRYRPAARQPQEANLSAAHLGFRTVLNMPSAKSP